jgi:hypothetical protein
MHPLSNPPRNALHNSTYRSPGNVSEFLGYPWIPFTPGVIGFLMIGNSASDFGGIPLPFDMTPIGAPGCQIVNNMLLSFAVAWTTSTFVRVDLTFPDDKSLVGITYFSQYLFFEPAANPLGIYTTNGRSNVSVPAQVGITRIYASGNPGATTGTVGVQFALPVGLQ